jgi:hypothetical protein
VFYCPSVNRSDVAQRPAAHLRYGRHATVGSQGCDDGSRAARSDHGLLASVTPSDVPQRHPVAWQPLSVLCGCEGQWPPGGAHAGLQCDSAARKRSAPPLAHWPCVMRAQKPSAESAGVEKSDRHSAQPTAHASAGAEQGPYTPPQGTPVRGARIETGAVSAAEQPCTVACSQKASHVPSLQPAGGSGGGGGMGPGASETQRKPTAPCRSYEGATSSSLLCVEAVTRRSLGKYQDDPQGCSSSPHERGPTVCGCQ